MTMYVVLGIDVWEDEVYVVGVYSTRAKAQEAINRICEEEASSDDNMWIDEHEVDIFEWE